MLVRRLETGGPAPLSSESGFGLIEVMISAGLLGLLAIGMTTVFGHQFRLAKAMERKVEVLDLRRNLSLMMADMGQCRRNLLNRTLELAPDKPVNSSLNDLQYFDKSGAAVQSIIKVNERLSPGSDVTVAAIELTDASQVDTGRFVATLRVTFATPDAEIRLKPIDIPGIQLHTTGALAIQDCNIPIAVFNGGVVNNTVANTNVTNPGGAAPSQGAVDPSASAGKPGSIAGAGGVVACPSGQMVVGFNGDGSLLCSAPVAVSDGAIRNYTGPLTVMVAGGTIGQISGNSGDVTIYGVNDVAGKISGNSGKVSITTSNASASEVSGNSGGVVVTAPPGSQGSPTTVRGNSGDVTVNGGGTAIGNSGDVNLTGGGTATGNSGDVTVNGGLVRNQ